jgi:hypothetical protein
MYESRFLSRFANRRLCFQVLLRMTIKYFGVNIVMLEEADAAAAAQCDFSDPLSAAQAGAAVLWVLAAVRSSIPGDTGLFLVGIASRPPVLSLLFCSDDAVARSAGDGDGGAGACVVASIE